MYRSIPNQFPSAPTLYCQNATVNGIHLPLNLGSRNRMNNYNFIMVTTGASYPNVACEGQSSEVQSRSNTFLGILILSILAYVMLQFPLKCGPAG